MRTRKNRAYIVAAIGSAMGAAMAAHADVILKANNTDELTLGSSWVGGNAPGSDDVAVWDSTYTQTATLSLGAGAHWQGLEITGVLDDWTFSGGTLTLGSGGLRVDINKGFQFNNSIVLAASQNWVKNQGGTNVYQFAPITIGAHSLTVSGSGGVQQFKSFAFDGTGELILTHTNVRLENVSASDARVTIAEGSDVDLNGTSPGGAARFGSLTFRGGRLDAQNTGSNMNELIGATTLAAGHAIISISTTATSGRTQLVTLDSLTRHAGTTLQVRGVGLGTTGLATLMSGNANLKINTAPVLTGGGGAAGTKTISIIKGAFGDNTSTSGNGTGLVTYDSTYGVRLLDPVTEYRDTIISGQGYEPTPVLENIRLANSSGALSTVTLADNTRVNSLSLIVSAASSGITVTGAGSLVVDGGMIYAHQSVGSNAANAMTISVASLDFGGNEGVIIPAQASGTSNGGNAGNLDIQSAITNTGGNGLTFGSSHGSGIVYLTGSAVNTYTGVTTVNGGVLRLRRAEGGSSSSAIVSIPGDLVINGGQVINSFGNQLADTSNVTITGGTLYFNDSTNSGSSRNDTFNSLTMTGGAVSQGSGQENSVTILGAVNLSGGKFTGSPGMTLSAGGLTTLSGGVLDLRRADNANSTYQARAILAGGLTIQNTAGGAYTPITLQGGNGLEFGSKLEIGGTLTFVGNTSNYNTATIDALAPAEGDSWGIIGLDGNTTFNIGDGAAATDLLIVPGITDNPAAVAGVTKIGLGTLQLNGASTYSGATQINEGAVRVLGSIAGSGVSVAAGASFEIGTNLSIGDDTALTLTEGAVMNLNYDGSLFETVGLLTLGGVSYTEGIFNSSTNPEYFTGAGNIVATPEPASLGLVAMGAVGLLSRRRRRNLESA